MQRGANLSNFSSSAAKPHFAAKPHRGAAANVNPVPTLYPPTSRDIARRTQMQLCMIACSLVHIAYARSTNIDPSAAGALPSNLSQPTQECCLAEPEAAQPLRGGSRLYSICEPNGWATFSLLVLAQARLNRDGGGNKEVIQPDRRVAQRGRNSARWHCQSLAPAHPQRPHQLRAGEA